MGLLDKVKDVAGDVVDAVSPVDEIVDAGKNIMEGDLIGALGNVVDAATPIDEIVSAGSHLFGGPDLGISDITNDLPDKLPVLTKETDQGAAALIADLKQRGLLDETLVIWGGEFGRTVYSQGTLTKTDYGRDHHPRCFTVWAAGGGMKPGLVYGETDDYCYNVVRDPVHVHDFNATVLTLLGIDHERLTYRFQGRDFRLTDVHGNVVKALLA